jgi:hypothetical protein
VDGRSRPARLGAGWAILLWIAFSGVVGWELWPWIPHTWVGVAGVLLLGPPLWVLAEFAGDRIVQSIPARAVGEPSSRALRLFDRVLMFGLLLLVATIAIFWWVGRNA